MAVRRGLVVVALRDDLLGEAREQLVDALRRQRGRLKVLVAVQLAPLLRLLLRDLPLLRGAVDLVPDDVDRNVVQVRVVDAVDEVRLPLLKVVERLEVRHVKDKDAAVAPAVERRDDAVVALVPRRVPDLQRVLVPVDRHRLDQKVAPDGRLVDVAVLVVDVAVDQ